ncbi:MAG: hypothetical protein ABIS69_05155 [Sediminibacterium sp.]
MLKYNYQKKSIESRGNQEWFFEARLNYFASEIMELLEIKEATEIALSLSRAFQAFGTLDLPFNLNFKRVFRSDGKTVSIDWKISPLACYLIVINSNPVHERVAKAQLFFAMQKTGL